MNILKNRLFGKLFALVFLAIFLILFTFLMQSINYQKKSILDSLSSESKSIADSIAFVKKQSMIVDNEIDLLEFIFEFVKQSKQMKNFILVRKDGNEISVKKDTWQLLEYKNFYTHYQSDVVNYEIIYSPYLNQRVFKYTYPIFIAGIQWGWFHFEMDLNEYDKKIQEMYDNIAFLAMTLIATSLFVTYLITTMVVYPIIKLSKISKNISQGDLTQRANIKTNDEIGDMAKAFNTMLDSLVKSQSELKKSHDELELRVEERTRELKELNLSLEDKSTQLRELNENLENKVVDEISKRQRQQQLLIQQSKLAAMGEMIGNIAHQWRQPLNALSLVIQNIDFSYKIGELDEAYMDKSIKKANLLTSTMSKTIDDFRNFFRPNKEKKHFSVNDQIAKALSLIDATLQNNNIKLEYESKNQLSAFGFENEFSQVILNIINNSKDAIIENKISNAFIKIILKENEGFTEVIIEDNAGGIPEKIINKVFDPYFTTKEEGKGTGIGLYMSKTIIEENMDGRILVENNDIGAKFTIRIPIYEEQ